MSVKFGFQFKILTGFTENLQPLNRIIPLVCITISINHLIFTSHDYT